MNANVSQSWINFFYAGSNLIAILAVVVGVIAAYMFLSATKDFLGRDTRQHVKTSTLAAYFLVAGIGLSFASFTNNVNSTVYNGTGAEFSEGQNPLTWRADSAPQLNGVAPQLMIAAVIVIGFGFLGALAFYLALLTMFRFNSLHPQHQGCYKDFSMYTLGGVICSNLVPVAKILSNGIPFLTSTADLIQRASAHI